MRGAGHSVAVRGHQTHYQRRVVWQVAEKVEVTIGLNQIDYFAPGEEEEGRPGRRMNYSGSSHLPARLVPVPTRKRKHPGCRSRLLHSRLVDKGEPVALPIKDQMDPVPYPVLQAGTLQIAALEEADLLAHSGSTGFH